MLEEAKARLETGVPALSGRIEEAVSLAELMRRNQAPHTTPAAFLLPLGLRGGAVQSMAGVFVQSMETILGIVLMLRSDGDVRGARGFDRLSPIITAVLIAIAGWAPDSAVGVFRLSRGELVSIAGGLIVYQLDFALDDQLRN